jgi:hypothetical protein
MRQRTRQQISQSWVTGTTPATLAEGEERRFARRAD